MHAFLIVGNGEDVIANRFDMPKIPFVLQKIEDARELKKITKYKFSQKTAIVINDIDNATEEALNAFLKDLEEPNDNLVYILTANNLGSVMPTIISRCEVIKNVNFKLQILNQSQITNFLDSKTKQKITIVEQIKDRDQAIKFVEDLILFSREGGNFNHMEIYLKTLKNLRLNGNIGLQLTNLVVRMNGDGK